MRRRRSRGGRHVAVSAMRPGRRSAGGRHTESGGRRTGSGSRRTESKSRRALGLRGQALRFTVGAVLLPAAVGTAAPGAAPLPSPTAAGHDARLPHTRLVQAATATAPVASLTQVDTTRAASAAAATPVRVALARHAGTRVVGAHALRAYRIAESTMRIADPSCRLRWNLLAGIARVEADHGPAGDAADAALGPMGFLATTWAVVGVDGDADGRRDRDDIDDAALAAAAYLCAGTEDLTTSTGARGAVRSYNRSPEYAALALGFARAYERSVKRLPPLAAAALSPSGPGVTVGVGEPGQGVLVGASDDVAGEAGSQRDPKPRRRDQQPPGDDRPDVAARRAGGPDQRTDHERPRPHGNRIDRPGSRPDHDRPGREGDGGRESTPPRHAPQGRPDKPADHKPAKKPAGKVGGGTDGDRRPDPSSKPRPKPKPSPTPEPTPSAKAYSGTVVACGAGFCLENSGYALSGSMVFDAYLGESITVVAVLKGSTLLVEQIR